MAKEKGITIAWFSAGITSAVACKAALEMYNNVRIYYIHIDSAHGDNDRFIKECEEWYGCKINIISSDFYSDQFEVIEHKRAVNTPYGAPCTGELKKQVRFALERSFERSLFQTEFISNQVWGFEFTRKEVNRAIRHAEQYPDTKPLFPLIEKGLTKEDCLYILEESGIKKPEMYRLGFSNNNCIGCVKGGMGYWNLIRVHFPDVFDRMAILEREVGYSCINGVFLDELDPNRGRMQKEIMPSCGVVCDLDFANIPHRSLCEIMSGETSIYDAIIKK